MTDRRRSRRRRMPFVRSAILESGTTSHIVVVSDLSPEGAFLATRVPIEKPKSVTLRVVVPRDGRVLSLRCLVVRRSEVFDAATGCPAGIAVRFESLDAATARRLTEFANESFLASSEPTPLQHIEYRVVERTTLAADELNRLGLDGWQLAAAVPCAAGVRLVLSRRL